MKFRGDNMSSTCMFLFTVNMQSFWAESVYDIYVVTSIPSCVSDIYAKISVNEIKIGTLNAPLVFHQQIMVMNHSQGELVTAITQILVRMVI